MIRCRYTFTALIAALLTVTQTHAQPGWVLSHQKISDTEGGFKGVLRYKYELGFSVASLGDLDGDGVVDIAVGADGDWGTTFRRGAIWILFLNKDGTVKSHQKINDVEGGFSGVLEFGDQFGCSVSSLGDLNGDGVVDIAVGAVGDDYGEGLNLGAVWILFLNSDGTVNSHQKINAIDGGFTGTLDDHDRFGSSVAMLGDLDGDGVRDLAVGAREDDDGGPDRGAVWVLFLNTDGTVKSHQKISDTEGNFTAILEDDDLFGLSAVLMSDHDGDGVDDLAVGASSYSEGGWKSGAVWILFLNTDGTVKSHQVIHSPMGQSAFGSSLAYLGDFDGDGVGDLAAGAKLDDDGGGINKGAVWVMFLNTDGTVKSNQKISETEGGFTGDLDTADNFGCSVASLGDLNGDGAIDLTVGTFRDDDGGKPPNADHGAVWVLFLDVGSSSNVATLTNFSIDTGVLLDGTLTDLESSDDLYVHTRSGFGNTLIDLHSMEMIVNAVTTVDSASTIDLTIESRIDEPAGLAQIRMRNWNTNRFDYVGSYAIGNTDNVDVVNNIDATEYVNGQGEIDLSIKHLVFVPFLAFTFESFIDQVEIVVE